MTRHLQALSGTACASSAQFPTTRTVLAEVTCTRCAKAIERAEIEARELAYYNARQASAEKVGLGAIWHHTAADHTSSGRVLLGIIGALAQYLDETGFALTSERAA